MKKVYICSRYRGDVDRNVRSAKRYCLFAVTKGYLPIAPHLFFTRFLDDSIPEQRELGIQMGLELLDLCDEIWVFGNEITEGMEREIKSASSRFGRNIRCFSIDCRPIEHPNDLKRSYT